MRARTPARKERKRRLLKQHPAFARLVQDYLARGGDEAVVERSITEIVTTIEEPNDEGQAT